MNTREDLSAGIYVALTAFLFLGCFVLAFFGPSAANWRWLGGTAFLGFVVALPFLLRAAHRSRIHQAVNERGGVVTGLRKLPFWHNSLYNAFFLGEKFEVEYVDLLGRTHRARCKSGFFQGVEWVEDTAL
jgi:hypothetical protein